MFRRKLVPALLLSVCSAVAARSAAAQEWSHLLASGQRLPAVCDASTVRAGEGDTMPRQIELQGQQIELQNGQIEELRRRLDAGGGIPGAGQARKPTEAQGEVRKADFLDEQDTKKTDDEAKANKDYEVGSDLKMSVRWNTVNGVTFETPNKDFVSHIGVRFQYDSVWFSQDAQLRAPSQVGELQDGTFFRRVRPSWDGRAWEVVEWNVELALEQASQGIPNLDETWVGLTQIPYVGTVRVGHQKVPQGFEGDMVSSSKAMTFLEKAAYTDAFYQNFAPGLWAGNSVFDQHMTWSAMWYRQESALHGNNGADFGDGEYGFSGRLTLLPLYDNEGRHMLHLGVSGTWRTAEKQDPGLSDPRVVRFRARPELRDAIGDFGSGTLPGNSQRWVDTGVVIADSATVYGSELFYVRGPFSVQAEYAWAIANDAVVGGTGQGNLGFNGGYIELSYFLTGENRIYDRRLGRLGSTYIASVFTPFWVTRAEGGGTTWGRGAWEIAARWSHLDLNNGVGRGGQTDALELGVNWYLNVNFKLQFEYLHQNRYDLGPGQIAGDMDALGIRTQFFF